MINWKNIAENLILTLISVIVGVSIGYIVAINAANIIVEQQKSTIELAIKKQTTSITNQVKTEIRKVKSTKADPITIVIDPSTKNKLIQQHKDSVITIAPKKNKPRFLKRIFKKHKKQ